MGGDPVAHLHLPHDTCGQRAGPGIVRLRTRCKAVERHMALRVRAVTADCSRSSDQRVYIIVSFAYYDIDPLFRLQAALH